MRILFCQTAHICCVPCNCTCRTAPVWHTGTFSVLVAFIAFITSQRSPTHTLQPGVFWSGLCHLQCHNPILITSVPSKHGVAMPCVTAPLWQGDMSVIYLLSTPPPLNSGPCVITVWSWWHGGVWLLDTGHSNTDCADIASLAQHDRSAAGGGEGYQRLVTILL